MIRDNGNSTSVSCPVCGVLNPERYLFCLGCGQSLRAASTDSTIEPSRSAPSRTVCSACDAPNSTEFLFCANCGSVLQDSELEAQIADITDTDSATAATEPDDVREPDDVAFERPAPNFPDAICSTCGSTNPAEYSFCADCGNPLHAAEPKVISDPEPADAPVEQPASNRLQLRLTLILSAAILLILAFLIYAFSGVQWAIFPFALALTSIAVAAGGLSRKSFTLFLSDIKVFLAGKPAAAARTPDTLSEDVGPNSDSSEVYTAPSSPIAPPRSSAPTAPALPQANPDTPSHQSVTGATDTDAPAQAASTRRFNERRVGIAVMCIGLLSAMVSLYMFPQGPPNTLAWWSYILSVLLTIAAMPAFEGKWSALIHRFRHGEIVSFEYRAILIWGALSAILLFALLIRLYNLNEVPPGLWFDEADLIGEAIRISEEPSSTPVFVAFQNLPSLMSVLTAIQIEFTGISISTGRLVAAGFGLAGIAAMFLMMRYMAGTLMGLTAAFLIAVMRWDIIWSRVGLHAISLPFFAALSAWLTYRAIRSERASDFALAGISLGLGMWFYSPFRMFPLVIGFVLLHALVFAKSDGRRRLLVNIGVLVLFMLIVAAPVAEVALIYPEEFFRRTGVVFISNFVGEGETLSAIVDNFRRHILMFHIQGDPNGRHNIPGAPMLDVFSGMLMLVGLVVAVFRWRNAAYIVLPVWVLVMIMPGVLTIPWEAPQSLRSITVIPAVAALITLGLDFILRTAQSVGWRWVRFGAAAAVALLLAVIAYTNINTYFGEQAEHPEVYASFSTAESLMQIDVDELASRGYNPLVSRQFILIHTVYTHIYGGRLFREVIAAPESIPIDLKSVWHGAAVYLEPRESGFYDTLKTYYPDAEFHEVRPPTGGEVMYYAAYLSREQIEAAQGLVSRITQPDGEVVEHLKKSSESVWMLEDASEHTPFDVEWVGALHITHPGEYVLELESSSLAQVLLDGEVILSNRNPQIRIEPAVGLHALELRAQVEDNDSALRLLWKQPTSPSDEDEQSQQIDEPAAERSLEPIPASNLYHGDIRPVGLAGRFFKEVADTNEIGDAAPDAMRITPGIGGAFWYDPVVRGEHLAVWDGSLHVPESGLYQFKFGEVHGNLKLILDDDVVIDTRVERERSVELSEGERQIRLEYHTTGGSPWFEVLWTSPGKPEARIAPEYLSPAREYMFRIIDGE